MRDADLTKVRSMNRAKLDSADFTGATVSEASLSSIKWDSIKRRVSIDQLKWGDSEITARSVAIDGVRAQQNAPPLKSLQAHSADPSAYSSGLVDGLRDLVCTGAANSSYIARGLVLNHRIATVGNGTPVIVKAMVDGTCATTLALTSDDKATLVALKRAASQGKDN